MHLKVAMPAQVLSEDPETRQSVFIRSEDRCAWIGRRFFTLFTKHKQF